MKNYIEKMTEGTIEIIAQCFYGNRTGTNVKPENIDAFLKGWTDVQYYDPETEPVNRKLIHVPADENVVIVYDRIEEENYLTVEFPETYELIGKSYKEGTGRELTPYVSCHIPELDITLHTRCFACRIDENGNFCSLRPGDVRKFIDYFPVK